MSSQIFEPFNFQKSFPIIHDVKHSEREVTWIDPKFHLAGGVVACICSARGE